MEIGTHLKTVKITLNIFAVYVILKEKQTNVLCYTANIFDVIFMVFNCVPIFTLISLHGLHLIAAPSTVE